MKASFTPPQDGETTPKARPASMEQNPFDLLQERNANSSGRSNAMGIIGGDRAVDRASSPSVLFTPGYAQGRMSTDIANMAPMASRNAPEFMIELPPAKTRPEVKEATRQTGTAKGYLRVQVIEARGLGVSSPEHSRPYVVVQFDKNEYIGYDEENASHGACPVWNNAVTFDVTTEHQSVQISVSKGVAIQKPERGDKDEPLSSSVQEKFRGFSYSGSPESSVSYLENAIQAIDWGRDDAKDA
ncbi:unnamed protein product [Malassezia sympodialis ATCC 42132]|uniref:uncharacterized protein n=1 Tax=Malassezia sympodialis (strain ATCC 42132) TaxID=1230383 RepID=UPI0002C2A4EB|nr:uncharacterized protein MSY001_1606 [Malassezia sympodialis ATCC 42132]CCU98900.1 unnamed protein product [Malassezia sympodialis ATCC 42132]|eukprot:XP_018740176.1 uncharacterized protein MSY001_1606 [Malassezia sympodialis ATCC 42132]